MPAEKNWHMKVLRIKNRWAAHFIINAQTGFSQAEQNLMPGRSYVVRLYYYLPWDGSTLLEVKVSILQMILYRTKN